MIYINARLLEGRVIRIDIKDRGCGIEDVLMARQPLFTTDAENERSGMGFTVMESFCDNVKVSSKKGKGTTVTLIKKFSQRE
jgi:stage II sporulation protein AB (anti-sigma F factor)